MSTPRLLGFAARSSHATVLARHHALFPSSLTAAWRCSPATAYTSQALSPRRHPSSSFRIAPPQPPSIHPHSSSTETLPLPEQLRSLMRLLAHSVVVLTASEPQSSGVPSPRAMTMSSLTSLTLSPTPLVTFNIATPSRTLSALEGARRFNIHILRGGISGARVADWFSRGNAQGQAVFDGIIDPTPQRESTTDPIGPGCTAELAAGDEPPLLRGEGVLYVMRCKLLDDAPLGGLVQVRDHVIVVAEVEDIIESQEGQAKSNVQGVPETQASGQQARDDEFGLVYADRRYRRLGDTMIKD